MKIVLPCGAEITFDEAEDLQLTAMFRRLNTIAFASLLPHTEVRWAELRNVQRFCSLYGCLLKQHEHEALDKPYIFLDKRLGERSLTLLAELVLIHEMCHFNAATHDDSFVKEYLRALQRTSWETLVGRCVPTFRLSDLEI